MSVDVTVGMTNREKAFQSYDARNPEVWKSFQNFCVWLYEIVGARNYAAQEVFAVIRLQCRFSAQVSVDDGEGSVHTAPMPTMPMIKLQRNYIPHYTRKLIETDPRFKDFFDTRGD